MNGRPPGISDEAWLARVRDQYEREEAEPGAAPNGHDWTQLTPIPEVQDEPREPLKVVDVITLQGLPVPERRWLVPDWIPWGRVTGLYGPGGEGKTLLSQMLMTAAALGKEWMGLPVKRVKAFGFFCEDDEDELHLRQSEINKFYDCDFADLENMKWVARLGFENILLTFDQKRRPELTELWDELHAEADTFGANLVIIDTVSDCFAGNENDRGQARQFVQLALGSLARQLPGGAAVIGVAHPSLTGIASGSGGSGSTGWDATFRSRLYLTRPQIEEGEEGDPLARMLYRKKANWARREDQIPMRWKDGVFINPIRSTSAGGTLGSIERRKCRRVFLDLLQAMTDEGRPLSVNSKAGNYAPRVFSRRPDREGYRMADFERVMEELFASKEVATQPYVNEYRNTRQRIVINGRATAQ